MNEKTPLPIESTPHESHTAEFEGEIIDVYKLISLAEQVEPISLPVSQFENTKQNNYWHDSHGGWLGPQNIIDAVTSVDDPLTLIHDESIDIELRNHIQKVLDADYKSYPIIIIKGEVKDGMHRLTKAFIDGVDSIDVKNFDDLPEGLIFSN
jgi:hypothetical protein